ncbi:MAG: FHA domain-containing protein [Acidobacteriota bacterium]
MRSRRPAAWQERGFEPPVESFRIPAWNLPFCDDAKKPVFLRTHHAFGYSFTDDVVVEKAARTGRTGVQLWLVWGLNVLPLSEGDNVLGRDPSADVWIGDVSVSRQHARIRVRGGEATLEDLGSKNGTLHAGRRIEGGTPLKDGDGFRIGSIDLVFRAESISGSTLTAP